jgi:hypothetical protein
MRAKNACLPRESGSLSLDVASQVSRDETLDRVGASLQAATADPATVTTEELSGVAGKLTAGY